MTRLDSVKGEIITQALALSCEKGWDGFTMRDLSDRCITDSVLFRSLVKDKKDVFYLQCDSMKNFVNDNRTDDKETYDTMTIKDILFDVIMLHFDFLQLHKKQLDSLEKFVITHPDYALDFFYILPDIDFPIKNFISIKPIPYVGSAANRIALAGIFLYVYRTWKTDSSPDLSRTMAALDKALNFILKDE